MVDVLGVNEVAGEVELVLIIDGLGSWGCNSVDL
jgi:hypothetical protein